MTTHSYQSVRHQQQVDGGYSGQLTVTAAEGHDPEQSLIFVDSDLVPCSLVLQPQEVVHLAAALVQAYAEVLKS